MAYNNIGAPTRPTRSIADLFVFIASSEALEKAIDFLSYGLDLNSDQIQGLDSYSSENDERMIDLLK